jgi:hypothetical protein
LLVQQETGLQVAESAVYREVFIAADEGGEIGIAIFELFDCVLSSAVDVVKEQWASGS